MKSKTRASCRKSSGSGPRCIPNFRFCRANSRFASSRSEHDRAALLSHDIAIQAIRDTEGEIGYRVFVGGGLGRTPYLALEAGSFVPKRHILAFLEAILRVYNEAGRRDNLWKARVKILVHQIGIEDMRRRIEKEFAEIKSTGHAGSCRPRNWSASPPISRRLHSRTCPPHCRNFETAKRQSPEFAAWSRTNLHPHKAAGYALATVSLKAVGKTPGDCTSEQMEGLADIMDDFGFAEIRVTHEQNLLLPHVRRNDLFRLWQALGELELAIANHGLITDIISCPGLDYCDLANARSIPIAQKIAKRFADPGLQADLGELKIKISGCINACGHHHLGHIGILGVDRKGVENYQILLGGSGAEDASLGEILGPGFDSEGIVDAVENVIAHLPGVSTWRRAVPRHLPPDRPGAVQGTPVCSLAAHRLCTGAGA